MKIFLQAVGLVGLVAANGPSGNRDTEITYENVGRVSGTAFVVAGLTGSSCTKLKMKWFTENDLPTGVKKAAVELQVSLCVKPERLEDFPRGIVRVFGGLRQLLARLLNQSQR